MFVKNIWMAVVSLLHSQPDTHIAEEVNLKLANSIRSSINGSVRPCEDFYSYACGNYAEQNPSVHYQEMTSYMDYQYNTAILNLIETIYQHDHQVPEQCQSFVEKTRIYWKACCRETKRNVKRYFEEIKPAPWLNWPILELTVNKVKHHHHHPWPYGREFNVWSLLGKLQSYGMNNVLINQEISVDRNGQLSVILEPAFSDNNSTLPDDTILQVLLMTLGVQNPASTIYTLKQTDQVLVNILDSYSSDTDESLAEVDDLVKLYPQLDLHAYLKELLGDRKVPGDTVVLIRNPSYFQHLNDNLWWDFEKPQLCNYLMAKFLFFLAVDSTAEFNSMACIKDLRNKFDLAVNYLYYYHIYVHQSHHVNNDIKSIFVNINNMLDNMFRRNNLHLENSQVTALLDKLARVRLNIGNLPEGATFAEIENFYASVPPMDKNNYYKNHLLLLRHRFAKSLHYAENQTHFIVPDNSLGSSSSAFYVAKQNMIILPFGSLRKPMYDFQYHDLFKYSLLGFILAHELTHAFDTYGLSFNSRGENSPVLSGIINNGNMQNSLKCLQSQLATDSIDERMADIVATRVVYKLYISRYNNLKPICLNDNWNKFFYLGMAQFFCGKNNIEFIDHDSDAERLNQIVLNAEGFAQAFKCPLDSAMNPKEKCHLY